MTPDAMPGTAGPRPEAGQAAGNPVSGYTLVLPPEWHQIPVQRGTSAAIRKIADTAFARLPAGVSRDQITPYRIELERRLSEAASQARRRGGVHLYLPVGPRHGTPIAASFVVSQGSLGSMADIDPQLLVSALATGDALGGDAGTGTVTMDGAPGLRREHTAPGDPGNGIDYGSRRVDYLAPVPGQRDEWLVVAFSTPGGGDPDDKYARILTELFDAIMSTFRWTRADAGGPGGGPGE